MKQINIILFSCLFVTVAMAQKPYITYDWRGKVDMKEYKAEQWLPIRKDQEVSGLDSVSIDKNGFLRIIDTRSNLIYKSTDIGKMRVLNIITNAKRQNSQTLTAINRELLHGVQQSSSETTSMQVVGATTRSMDDNDITDSIISTFGWLANQALQNELPINATDLTLQKHSVREGVCFEIHNMSSENYYVNILHIDQKTKKVSLCYIIEQTYETEAPYLFLPQNKSLQMKNIFFNLDADQDIFILIGTEDKYIPEQVQGELQYLNLESTQPLYSKYKHYKL